MKNLPRPIARTQTSQATRNARLGAVGNGIEVVGIKVVGIKVVGNRIEVVGNRLEVVGNRFGLRAVGIKAVGNRFDLNRTDVVAINVTDQNQTTEPMLKRLSQTKPLLHSQATWVAEEPDAGHRETHHALPPSKPDPHVCLCRALPPALVPSIPTPQMQTKNPCRLPTRTSAHFASIKRTTRQLSCCITTAAVWHVNMRTTCRSCKCATPCHLG
jgi:hypothetical protein